MNELNTLIENYDKVCERIEAMEAVMKENKQLRDQFAHEIATYFRDNMLKKQEFEDRTISASFETRFSILGGHKNSEQRNTVLEVLEELGYGDDIQTFKDMHETKFQTAMKSLPINVRQNLVTEKMISVWERPKISIRRKAAAAV